MKQRIQIRYTSQEKRSSWVKQRKSICEDDLEDKHVTWSPVEETVQDASNPYSGIPKDEIWYSRDELREIKVDNETIASLCSLNANKCPSDATMRGLEGMTDQGAWERFVNHRDCVNKVLDEQDRQKGIDSTECQYSPYPIVKRINHLHIPFDHERLAALCRDATAKARRAATLRGRRDAMDAEQQVPTSELIKVFENLAARSKEAVIVKDSDTVQTEDSSQATSTESNPAAVEQDSPVPQVVQLEFNLPLPKQPESSPVTPLTLEKKTKERYAAYLINRERRLQEREQAASDYEKRRLTRQASIRMEADSSIERLKRIMKLSDEMVAIVAASDIV